MIDGTTWQRWGLFSIRRVLGSRFADIWPMVGTVDGERQIIGWNWGVFSRAPLDVVARGEVADPIDAQAAADEALETVTKQADQ